MIVPVRCFTCGKTLADKYDYYLKEAEALRKAMEAAEEAGGAAGGAGASGGAPKAAAAAAKPAAAVAAEKHFEALKTGPLLDALGLTRYCCRRHMLTTVDMMEII